MATGFRKGETVVAMKNIGGFARTFVPQGAFGIVTRSGWTGADVVFTIRRRWTPDETVFVTVYPDEVVRA
ncbi:hypothetical protein [Microbacterium enclense]|uniref:hypothetical protein n=1 Tax=Microbacterium enclense TaxID=993073 RepID=UPI003F7F8A43